MKCKDPAPSECLLSPSAHLPTGCFWDSASITRSANFSGHPSSSEPQLTQLFPTLHNTFPSFPSHSTIPEVAAPSSVKSIISVSSQNSPSTYGPHWKASMTSRTSLLCCPHQVHEKFLEIGIVITHSFISSFTKC